MNLTPNLNSSVDKARRWLWTSAAMLMLGMTTMGANCDPNQLQDSFKTPEAKEWLAQLNNQLKVLSRDVLVYHWAPRQNLGLPNTGWVDPNDSHLAPYLQKQIQNFWDLNQVKSGAVGNGIYLSVDPVASRYYGQDQWALVQVKMPKGIRMLDVRPEDDRYFPAEIQKMVQDNNCGEQSLHDLLASYDNNCRGIASQVLMSLNVDAVIYSFPSTPLSLCPNRVSTAYEGIKPSAIEMTSATLFTADMKTPDPLLEQRLLIEEFFQSAETFDAKNLPWPTLSSQKPTEDFAAWLKTNLVGCGDYPEDLPLRSASAVRMRFAAIQARAKALSAKLGTPVDPLLFKDLAARRFIDAPDWKAFTAAGGTDPSLVYNPAPTTWNSWWSVNTHEFAASVSAQSPLSATVLQTWNNGGLLGQVNPSIAKANLGDFFNYFYSGRTYDSSAISAAQITNLTKTTLYDGTNSAMTWTALSCREDTPDTLKFPGNNPECQAAYKAAGSLAPNDPFWKQTLSDMNAGQFKDKWYWAACWPRISSSNFPHQGTQCGMIRHTLRDTAAGHPFSDHLNALFTYINEQLDPLSKLAKDDIVEVAINAQRWIEAMAPYETNSGRVSRWVMDYITLSAGLPPIIQKNMDQDLLTSDGINEMNSRDGLLLSLEIMENCLNQYETTPPDATAMKNLQNGVCGLLTP